MSCINSEIIQKYIDGELTPRQLSETELHLEDCPECVAKVNQRQKLAAGIKDAIRFLTDETLQAPLIALGGKHPDKRHFTAKRLFYYLSAACILLFAILFTFQKAPVNQEKNAIVTNTDWEVDANRPISQQELILNVIDGEGNITEYQIR